MRSHHHGDFPASGRAAGVSVVLPARECADTIEPIVAASSRAGMTTDTPWTRPAAGKSAW